MTGFVQGVKTLFTGAPSGDTDALKAQQQQSQQQQTAALNRQSQDLQNQQAQQDTALSAASRVPRGRRLLLAATGENGVSGTVG